MPLRRCSIGMDVVGRQATARTKIPPRNVPRATWAHHCGQRPPFVDWCLWRIRSAGPYGAASSIFRLCRGHDFRIANMPHRGAVCARGVVRVQRARDCTPECSSHGDERHPQCNRKCPHRRRLCAVLFWLSPPLLPSGASDGSYCRCASESYIGQFG